MTGSVFANTDGDGVRQSTEQGLAGRTIEVDTVSNRVVSATPVRTTTSDPTGDYGFMGLGPLPAGTSYLVVESLPSGWGQTSPAAGANTMTLPDGRIGYLVPAVSGFTITTSSGQSQTVGGSGTLKLDQFNNSTTGKVTYNDGVVLTGMLTLRTDPHQQWHGS